MLTSIVVLLSIATLLGCWAIYDAIGKVDEAARNDESIGIGILSISFHTSLIIVNVVNMVSTLASSRTRSKGRNADSYAEIMAKLDEAGNELRKSKAKRSLPPDE